MPQISWIDALSAVDTEKKFDEMSEQRRQALNKGDIEEIERLSLVLAALSRHAESIGVELTAA